MMAVVMAGGEGNRLRPLTTTVPKPMVPVVNKPIIGHIFNLLRKNNIGDAVVTLCYLTDFIKDYLENGAPSGVKVSYSMEDRPLGTAGSVKKVESHLDKTFVVLSGDLLTDIELSEIVKFHKEKGGSATIALTRVPNPVEYGIVTTDSEGRIASFLEKPEWGQVFTDTVNAGIYVLEPEVLKYIPEDKQFDFSKDLFPTLTREKEQIYGCIADGYWSDIGNIEQYQQANYDALQGRVKLDIPGKEVQRSVWVDEGTEVEPGVELRPPIMIGRDCVVREGSRIGELSVVGSNVIVENGTSIKRSIVWDNTTLRSMAELSGCIVGGKCDVRSRAKILENAVVADECTIGQQAVVKYGVRIWPGKAVDAGAVVNMNLKWGIRWMRTLFGTHGIAGIANIEITPEFASKLGSAFGSSLGKGSRVIVGRDTHRVSRTIKRALTAGLTSAGANVLNLAVMPAPVTRYAVKTLGADAGVFVKVQEIDPSSVSIQFFDSSGLDLEGGDERRVERIFFQESFRRVDSNEIGDIVYPAGVIDFYRKGVMKVMDLEAMKKGHLKVVVDCANGSGSFVVPSLLEQLGCEVTTLNARMDECVGPRTFDEMPRTVARLSKVVKALDADIGLALDGDADRLLLTDEQGNSVQGDTALALFAREVLERKKNAKIVVPVSVSRVVENVAEELGGTVIRTRIGARPLLDAVIRENASFGGGENGGFVFPEFQVGYDGIVSAGRLIETLSQKGTSLSEIVNRIPPFYTARISVPCPWERRGRVMRSIVEEVRGREIDTLDGVKIFYDANWVLLHPSPEEPAIYLYAEATSKETASNLIDEYSEKVRSLVA